MHISAEVFHVHMQIKSALLLGLCAYMHNAEIWSFHLSTQNKIHASIRIVRIYAQARDLEFLQPYADTPKLDEILVQNAKRPSGD